MELYKYTFENGVLTYNAIEAIETSKMYKVKNKGEYFPGYRSQIRKEELPFIETTFYGGVIVLNNIDDKNYAIGKIREYYENELNVAKNKLKEAQDDLESFEQAIKAEARERNDIRRGD